MPPVGGFAKMLRFFTGRAKQDLMASAKLAEHYHPNPDGLGISRQAREAMAAVFKAPVQAIESNLNAGERLAVSTILKEAQITDRTMKVVRTVEWSRGYWREVMAEARQLEHVGIDQNIFSRTARDHQRIGMANLRTVLATNTGLVPTHNAIDQLLALATHH